MPKKKKRGKNSKSKNKPVQKRAIQFKDDMQEYALMTKMLGDRRIMVTLPDGSEHLAIIPGRFRKRCWMKAGDILLVSYREFQTNKLDVIHKYDSEESRRLIGLGEIPVSFSDSNHAENENDDDNIGFVIEDDNEELNFDDI